MSRHWVRAENVNTRSYVEWDRPHEKKTKNKKKTAVLFCLLPEKVPMFFFFVVFAFRWWILMFESNFWHYSNTSCLMYCSVVSSSSGIMNHSYICSVTTPTPHLLHLGDLACALCIIWSFVSTFASSCPISLDSDAEAIAPLWRIRKSGNV